MDGQQRTILLVDHHPLFHLGLEGAFRKLRPDYRLVSALNIDCGLQLLSQTRTVDLAIIDVDAPDQDGFDAVARVARLRPRLPCVLIAGAEDQSTPLRAELNGAKGYISKVWPIEYLVIVLDKVLSGLSTFPQRERPWPNAVRTSMLEDPGLTQRQIEVLELLAQGKSNKQIGDQLDIADRTVRAHLTVLFQNLGVQSRTQAVLQAQKSGLLG